MINTEDVKETGEALDFLLMLMVPAAMAAYLQSSKGNDEAIRLGPGIHKRLQIVHALQQELLAVQQEKDSLLTELGALRAKEPPLLQCADCNNTESCAGAMARYFNHGRCLRCGGYFKVVRA